MCPIGRILLGVPLLLVVPVVAVGAAVALWAAWRTLRDQPVVLRQLLLAGVAELLLLVQLVVAGVASARGWGPVDAGTWWGYAVTALLVLPVAAAWAFAERTRWSSVVLLVAAVSVVFLEYRMVELWAGA